MEMLSTLGLFSCASAIIVTCRAWPSAGAVDVSWLRLSSISDELRHYQHSVTPSGRAPPHSCSLGAPAYTCSLGAPPNSCFPGVPPYCYLGAPPHSCFPGVPPYSCYLGAPPNSCSSRPASVDCTAISASAEHLPAGPSRRALIDNRSQP